MSSETGRRFGDGGPDPATCFAPSHRATEAEVLASSRSVRAVPTLQAVMDSAGQMVAVLNGSRQIVAANAELLAAAGASSLEAVVGRRIGEALQCSNAWANEGGCGTSERCGGCGAVLAILSSQRVRHVAEQECLMTLTHRGFEEAAEFHVKASPVSIEGEELTVVSMRDISAQKRREALEQVFFHDILNTMSGLYGYAQVVRMKAGGELQHAATRLCVIVERLKQEVLEHRTLVGAEDGTLTPHFSQTESGQIFGRVMEWLEGYELSQTRTLEIVPGECGALETDASLLVRVLTNMLKNALEAGPRGSVVRAWCESIGSERVAFRVWNRETMAPPVASHIFQRSFSTKAPRGRGLGTYSMKLLGERYLGGRVEFVSRPDQGTTFSITLPRAPGKGSGLA